MSLDTLRINRTKDKLHLCVYGILHLLERKTDQLKDGVALYWDDQISQILSKRPKPFGRSAEIYKVPIPKFVHMVSSDGENIEKGLGYIFGVVGEFFLIMIPYFKQDLCYLITKNVIRMYQAGRQQLQRYEGTYMFDTIRTQLRKNPKRPVEIFTDAIFGIQIPNKTLYKTYKYVIEAIESDHIQ